MLDFSSCFVCLRCRRDRPRVWARRKMWGNVGKCFRFVRRRWKHLRPAGCAARANLLGAPPLYSCFRACSSGRIRGHRSRGASVRLPGTVALTVYGRCRGELGGKLQWNGGHAGGCWTGFTEGQGDGVDGPARGVRPLHGRGQDGETAFSQDSGEEGQTSERRPAPRRRRLGTGGGGKVLTRRETGLRSVNQARARSQKMLPNLHNSWGEDAREDRRAGRNGAAERGRWGYRAGPHPPSPVFVQILWQERLSRGSRRCQTVCRVGETRSICKETRAHLRKPGSARARPLGNASMFTNSCFHKGSPGSHVASHIFSLSSDWGTRSAFRGAHVILRRLQLKSKYIFIGIFYLYCEVSFIEKKKNHYLIWSAIELKFTQILHHF